MTNPRESRLLSLAHGRTLPLGARSLVMGILNVTPDSFSDGGRFGSDPEAAVDAAMAMAMAGADIIDIGGESTRPDAAPVDAAAELSRILPVIERLARTDLVLSIDTYRAETAARAVEAGAHLINDVFAGTRMPSTIAVAARTGAALCLMHTGRERRPDPDPIADQGLFLRPAIAAARRAGVPDDRLLIDPGFGFAKDPGTNLELMRRFGELHEFGLPILVGTSRKRFLRALVGTAERADAGTAATSVALRLAGAAIFRVHDVAVNRAALDVADALLGDVR